MGRENGVIYALGFFDGVHKGHQAILQETKALAARHGLRAGVFTYENHPQAVVGGGAAADFCRSRHRGNCNDPL